MTVCHLAAALRALWLLALLPALFTGLPVPLALSDPKPPTPSVVPCDSKASHCLSRGQLPHSDGRCFDPLERGPCSDGEWFVLSSSTRAGVEPLRAHCTPRACSLGSLPFKGRCLSGADARARLCGGGVAAYLDPEGLPRCGEQPARRDLLAAHVTCRVRVARMTTELATTGTDVPLRSTMVFVNGVPCAQNDEKECVQHVESTTPMFILQSETA